MTKAEIITAVRSLVNEISTDAGAKLSDTGNMLEFLADAMEQVTLDLIDFMPRFLLGTEDVSLEADTESYTLTAEFWQIYKVERNVDDGRPKTIRIIDPLEKHNYTDVGETREEPRAIYFLGNTLYPIPIPSVDTTDYMTVYYVRPEATAMATGGPSYIPRPAHRLIVYQACVLIAIAFDADPKPYEFLYQKRLDKVRSVWATFQHSGPMFLRGAYEESLSGGPLDRTGYDPNWD
uniref:Uncharacterized protein n=1 Tax=viral metagenome TaxID=1070528 RepID=A0A6M3J0C4_9ZZZZ